MGTKSFLSWVTHFIWASYWFFLLTIVLLHGRVSGLTGKERTSPGHLFLAGFLDGPHCPRLSERLPLNPGRRNELLPSFVRWEVGKCQLWVSLFFGWGIQDTLPLCYASHSEFPNHLAAFLASFRVLLCLFLMPFPGFMLSGKEQGKSLYHLVWTRRPSPTEFYVFFIC